MSNHVIEVTDGNFENEVLQSDGPVLVDFWAPWCGPCRQLGPTVETVAARYQGGVRVVKVNIDENISTAQRFGIKSIPTLVLFYNGTESERLIGAASEKVIVDMIESHINRPVAA